MMNLSKMKHLKSIRLVLFCHPTRNFLMLEFCLFRACSVFNDLSKIQIKLLTVNLLLTLSNLTPEWTRIIKLLDWQVQNYFVTHWVHSRMCKPLWYCTFDLQWEVNLWPWLCWCVGLRHVIFFLPEKDTEWSDSWLLRASSSFILSWRLLWFSDLLFQRQLCSVQHTTLPVNYETLLL